jgi:hypothetical protein
MTHVPTHREIGTIDLQRMPAWWIIPYSLFIASAKSAMWTPRRLYGLVGVDDTADARYVFDDERIIECFAQGRSRSQATPAILKRVKL